MKIGSPIPRSGLHPLRTHTGRVPSGSLLVSDVFQESEPANLDTHGGSVVASARDLGFQGPIFYQQAVSRSLPILQKAEDAIQGLGTPGLSPDEVQQSLQTFAVGPPLHMLQSGAEEVRRALESGASHSVLSLSSGTCKAQVSKILYDQAALAWTSDSPEQQERGFYVAQNLSESFGLSLQNLANPNQAVSGLERRKLQNALIQSVHRAWSQDSRLETARQDFSQVVTEFESHHNSVVVAAGNEGLIAPRMEMQGVGPLELPKDFERNVLDVEPVTLVGATIILDGEEGHARYTSGNQEIDIYASGDRKMGTEFDDRLGLQNAGTSMAAPRIGAVMARLHKQHPEMSSEQVETLLHQEFSSTPLAILDYPKARDILET